MKFKKIFIISIILFLLGAVLYNLPKFNSFDDDGSKIKITTSFYPYYFFASKIGGDKVNVINITPPGTEPHDYDLTSGDIINIQTSKILVLNGEVEPWKNKVVNDLKNKDVKVVITDKGTFSLNTEDEDGKKIKDPHIWLSPVLSKTIVDQITKALIGVDSSNKDYYELNSTRVISELNELHNKYLSGLNSCEQRNIVTTHSAFGYLVEQYNLKQTPITGLSPEEEPSLKQITEVANFARANNVKYIFFESLISPKLANTIANEIGVGTLTLNPLEGLTQQELSEDKNYFTVMEDNLVNLRTALSCK